MKPLSMFVLAWVAMLGIPAHAAGEPAAKSASAPAAAAAPSQGCGKDMKSARHTGGPRSPVAPAGSAKSAMPCEGGGTAPAATPAKPAHDHGKFHKNQ